MTVTTERETEVLTEKEADSHNTEKNRETDREAG